jgi:ribonuclease HI
MDESPTDRVRLFTDGACSGNPGPGGWAFILEHPATGKVIDGSGAEPHTTNNRMELMGAIEGLSLLKRPCRVELVTDSQYLGKGLTEWMAGWKARDWKRKEGGQLKPVSNEDLWRRIDELSARHEITLKWVRGHQGHPENEACDRMAVAAYRTLMQDMKMERRQSG